jgi:hypothetical protein
MVLDHAAQQKRRDRFDRCGLRPPHFYSRAAFNFEQIASISFLSPGW